MNFLDKLKKSPTYWQSLANYLERGWGLLYSLILARVILPEEFGMFALGTSIAMVSSLLTRWEIGNLVRVEPYYRGEGFNLAWAMTRALVYAELLVIGLVVFVGYWLGLKPEVCWVIGIFGFFLALDKFCNLLRCDLEGNMDFKHNFKVKMVFTPLVALVTIPMGLMGFGVWALLSGAWIGTTVNWIVFRRANPREIKREPIRMDLVKKVIKPSFWQWLCYVGQTLITRGDKIVVGGIGNTTDLGYYNRSFNYTPLSFLGLGAFAGSPAIVIFSKLESMEAIWRFYRKRAYILVIAGIGFGLLWVFCAEWLVVSLFGGEWLPAVPYFKAFAMFGAVQGIYYLSCSLMQGCRLYRAQGLINLICILIALVIGLIVVENGIDIVYLLQFTMLLSACTMIFYVKNFFQLDSSK